MLKSKELKSEAFDILAAIQAYQNEIAKLNEAFKEKNDEIAAQLAIETETNAEIAKPAKNSK